MPPKKVSNLMLAILFGLVQCQDTPSNDELCDDIFEQSKELAICELKQFKTPELSENLNQVCGAKCNLGLKGLLAQLNTLGCERISPDVSNSTTTLKDYLEYQTTIQQSFCTTVTAGEYCLPKIMDKIPNYDPQGNQSIFAALSQNQDVICDECFKGIASKAAGNEMTVKLIPELKEIGEKVKSCPPTDISKVSGAAIPSAFGGLIFMVAFF